MTPEYGYVRWRSKLTGKEDGINYPVANPAQEVANLSHRFPDREHWFIPTSVNLGPTPSTSTREPPP